MRLDDLYKMISHIYGEQNAQRSATATFAHFVEVCGMLAIHDRKKKRETFNVESALCKALGWFFPLMSKFRVRSVEELVFRKYPDACPYCRLKPHRDSECKTVKGTSSTVDHGALRQKYVTNRAKMPQSLNEWQHMFSDIYPRNVEDKGRSTVGLLEELGELAEAIRVYERYPKFFAGEAADVFSYLMGLANEHALRIEQDNDVRFNFEDAMLRSYPGLCIQCGFQVCVCPAIPEATVGRMSKELDLASADDLFGFPHVEATTDGIRACNAALDYVGGYSALAKQIPLDRGEANKSLVLLFMELSNAVATAAPDLSASLGRAAIRVGREVTEPGSRQHTRLPEQDIRLLRDAMNAAGRPLGEVLSSRGSLTEKIGNMFKPIRVLLVSASPADESPLMVDREVRVIKEAIERSAERDRIALTPITSSTPDSLRRALLAAEFDVLHIAGHADQSGPVFDDGSGMSVQPSLEAIGRLVARYPTISCVVLNSCLSLANCGEPLADITVGMTDSIEDDAAIEFAKGFYDGLGAGKSIDIAIEEGISATDLRNLRVPIKVLRRTVLPSSSRT